MSKIKMLLIPVALVAIIAAWQGVTYLWRHGYSAGERSGIVRKVSVKGPPYCKYLSGELVLQGTQPGAANEVWEFTVDDRQEGNPVIQQLSEAERSGARTTFKYRQDLPMWWTCNPVQYKILSVVK